MAKIEYHHKETEHFPAYTETIEVRAWGLGGTVIQPFYIGGGRNCCANHNVWVEILYTVAGVQVFYTRTFLHLVSFEPGFAAQAERRLEQIVKKGKGRFALVDILPESAVILNIRTSKYEDENGEEKQYTSCELKISADIGAVFGRGSPGSYMTSIELPYLDLEEGVDFMRVLLHEIDAVQRGKHPDPAGFPAESSAWPAIRKLTQDAYNQIAATYQGDYFKNPRLDAAFDAWLARLPRGGRVLDVGCGHGDPVITRLLERGFRVTGSDLSPEMLRRARQAFPGADFVLQAATEIDDLAAFDGVCSFHSVVYLDLIDLLQAIRRLHFTLKPGGLLLLYGMDAAPDWRGEPFSHGLDQWMWSWHYGMHEMAGLLEEHGYFEVLEMQVMTEDEAEAQRIRAELEADLETVAEYARTNKLPDRSERERPGYPYLVVARRRER